MKLLALFGLMFFSAPALAQNFNPHEAPNHVGETATISGVVDEVHTSGRGNTFLDLGGKYPNQAFTGVIFRENSGEFPDVHSVQGKHVAIHGLIERYKDRPQIIMRSASQLTVE